MSFIKPEDRNQFTMMNRLDDLVHQNHPIRLLDAIIDHIVNENPERFTEKTEGDVGRPKYPSVIFLKLFLYGFFNGIRSSRKLEVETQRNVEVMWLLGRLSPDHWTISTYRKDHGDEIKFVTKRLSTFFYDKDYIKGETVAIDGSKFKANANRDVLTIDKIRKRLKRANEELEEYLDILCKNDCGEELAEELKDVPSQGERETILVDKIAELQQKVEELSRQKEKLEQIDRKCLCSTDADARLMMSRDGNIPAYNVQIVVDRKNKLIASSEVIADETDNQALRVMVESYQDQLGKVPTEVLTDKGYYTPDEIEKVEKEYGCTCYIPYREKRTSENDITFRYEKETDRYICSEGKPLKLFHKNRKKHKTFGDRYVGTECRDCRRRADCTTSSNGRNIDRYHNQEWRDQYKERINEQLSKLKMGWRKGLVEHVFGTIKCWGGKIPLLLRGLTKVATEINLYVTAYNLKRFFSLDTFERLMEIIKGYRWKLA